MSGATVPPATPSCQPLGYLQGAVTVPGDVCALVPLIAARSLGSSPSSLLLLPGPPPLVVNNLPFPAEHQDPIKAHRGEPFTKTKPCQLQHAVSEHWPYAGGDLLAGLSSPEGLLD